MRKISTTFKLNGDLLQEAVMEAKKRQQQGTYPFSCYYRKDGKWLGSFLCGDEQGDFLLFFNRDYEDAAMIVELIAKHCQIMNEEVCVYPLGTKSIERYETVTPNSYRIVDL